MLTRVIAALALVPLFIFIVIGGIPLYIAEIVILAMALREFYKAFNKISKPKTLDKAIEFINKIDIHDYNEKNKLIILAVYIRNTRM